MAGRLVDPLGGNRRAAERRALSSGAFSTASAAAFHTAQRQRGLYNFIDRGGFFSVPESTVLKLLIEIKGVFDSVFRIIDTVLEMIFIFILHPFLQYRSLLQLWPKRAGLFCDLQYKTSKKKGKGEKGDSGAVPTRERENVRVK